MRADERTNRESSTVARGLEQGDRPSEHRLWNKHSYRESRWDFRFQGHPRWWGSHRKRSPSGVKRSRVGPARRTSSRPRDRMCASRIAQLEERRRFSSDHVVSGKNGSSGLRPTAAGGQCSPAEQLSAARSCQARRNR